MKLVSSILMLIFQFWLVQGNCIWYDRCDGGLHCAYDGPAKPLKNATAAAMLLETCYDLDIGPNNETCCDNALIEATLTYLDLVKLFLGQCPSCYKSFVKNFCHMTCSPAQADFIKPTSLKPGPKPGQKLVTSIDYYISRDYVQGMWDSCINVQFKGAGMPALFLLCGEAGTTCTPEKLMHYLGHNYLQSPPIRYFIDNQAPVHGFKPMNASTVPCQKPYKKGAPICKCKDCPAAC